MSQSSTPTTRVQTHPQLRSALLYLASRCDGANELDGQGFNGCDSSFGHSLADRCRSRELTKKEQSKAWEMLQKYQKQLQGGNISLPNQTELDAYLKGEPLEVQPLPGDEWLIRNPVKNTHYLVNSLGGIYQCMCTAATFGIECDHIKAVRTIVGSAAQELDRVLELDKPVENENPFRVGLSANQKEAFDLALEWFNSKPSEPLVIRGFAGVGKSFTIQRIVKALKAQRPNLKVALVSPTHKARHVLEEFAVKAELEVHITTLHSLLHVRPGNYDDKGRSKLVKNFDSRAPYYDEFHLVVVDEGSMIGDELFNAVPLSIPTIFMCDFAQLPPVEEEEIGKEAKDSPVSLLPVGIELTQVMRYEGAIAEYVTTLRADLERQFPPKVTTGGNMTRLGKDEWEESLIKSFKGINIHENPNAVRALAWTNKRVSAINTIVREAIYHDASLPYQTGERLMAKEPIFLPSQWGNKEIVMYSCAECTVDNVYKGTERLKGHAISTYRLEVTSDLGRELVLNVVAEDSWEQVQEILKAEKKDILSLPAGRSSRWAEYYELLERFNLVMKGNTMLSRLQYAYSLTVHQSQGSTFQHVYVDTSNIFGCRVVKTRNQLLYVAYSRASEHLSVLSRY